MHSAKKSSKQIYMLKLRGETKTNVALCLQASFVLPRQQSLCGEFVELEDKNLEMKSEDKYYIWIKAEDEYYCFN